MKTKEDLGGFIKSHSKLMFTLCIVLLCSNGTGCASAKTNGSADAGRVSQDAAPLERIVELVGADRQKIGTATLRDSVGTPDQLTIAIQAAGLTPGLHAVHLHSKGSCLAPDFKSAGDHFNPEGKHHGLNNPQGPHAGDFPNIEVQANGIVVTELKTSRATLKDGPASLLKAGGTALVIHAKADDQASDPSGNSGDRIACGVIQ